MPGSIFPCWIIDYCLILIRTWVLLNVSSGAFVSALAYRGRAEANVVCGSCLLGCPDLVRYYEGPLVALKVSVPWDSKEWEIIIVLSFLEDLLRTIHYSGCFTYVTSLVIFKEHLYKVDRSSMALILQKRKLRLGRGWIPCPESHTWLASESCSAAHPGLSGKAWAPALPWTCFSDPYGC